MAISDRINEIIDRRKGRNGFEGRGHLQVIQKKKKFFTELQRSVEEYQTLREMILRKIQMQEGEYYTMSIEDPTFENKVELADASKVLEQLKRCLSECDRLEQRFGREAVNISVIGLAGQGKSTLLQSIANLNNSIIPAADGADCTGAKSVICNSETPTYAKIIFYNDVELIEQIGRYISALHLPVSLGSTRQIPSLRSYIEAFKSQHTENTGDGGQRKSTLSPAEKKHLAHLEK